MLDLKSRDSTSPDKTLIHDKPGLLFYTMDDPTKNRPNTMSKSTFKK